MSEIKSFDPLNYETHKEYLSHRQLLKSLCCGIISPNFSTTPLRANI